MNQKPCSSPFRNLLPILAFLWLAISAVHGQSTWRSTLYPANWQPPSESASFATAKLIQDFSYAGYRRGEEFIPTITGPIFNVTNYGADPTGTTDSTLAIQSAINAAAAAGGGVVFLPAGEFRVSPQGNQCLRISSSNIVLRGAGTAQTFLLNTSRTMNGKAVIQVSPSSTSTGTPQNITANLPGPTRRIPVENAGNFSRGNIVRIQWNFTSDWVTENKQQTWWGTSQPSSAIYFREVMATDPAAGWIEVDVPTRYWIKTRDNPTVRTVSGLLRNVAIESLSIGNVQHTGSGWGEEDYTDATKAAYDAHASWLIRFQNMRDSWIRSVHSYQVDTNTRTCHLLSNGILLGSCLRITVQNCQMRRPQYGGGGGNGYMYRLQNSNECLLQNCVADFSRHGFVISHAGTSGNVFHQCEDRETGRAIGSSSTGYTTSGSGSDNHMHFSHSNLWDQCHAHNSFYTAHHRMLFGGSTPHGVTSAHAVYWNTSGSGTRYDDSGNPIVRSEQLNQGYIIGTRATSGTAYFASNPTGGSTSPADHLEGINTAATLQPQSLFLDQVSRRLRPTITFASNGGSTAVPASIQLIFGEPYGTLPATSRPGFIFTGWFTELSGGTLVTAATTVANSADHTLHARWNALPSVDAGPDRALVLHQSLPWSPAMVATAAWFDAADPATITASAGAVSLWQDKSGKQNHASQSTASRRPSTGTRTIGGLNAIAFDPFKDQHLAAAHHASLNLDASGGANLFAVFNTTGYVSRNSGLNSIVSKGPLLVAGASYGIRLNVDNRLPFKAGEDFICTPPEVITSQDLIYSGTRDDGTSTAYINGLQRATATTAALSSNNSSALVLGGETTTSRCADVRLGEFIIVSAAVTGDLRQRIEGYLAHKWALAGSLPADHRHKASPPLTPAATTTLGGTASDPESDPLTTTWSMVSGPAPVAFTDGSAGTTATFTLAGTYILRLTAADDSGSRSDDIVITVDDFVPPNPFDQWAGAPESSFMQDSNADGLPDGLAWLLGAVSPETSAATLLPIPLQENDALSITFNYLIPANRGSASLRLQHSPDLAPGSWTDITVPDASGTIDGVKFFLTPLPGGNLNQIKAVVPAGPAGRIFVRLAATVPGS
jgi:uncharacterized repeat protein (TIGR02543 family)